MTAPLTDATVLHVRPLTVVPEGEEFIVGDPEASHYVLLPAVGVSVLECLQAGQPIGAAAVAARQSVGEDVDVAAFAASLLELGFARLPDAAELPVLAPPHVPRWMRAGFSPAAWAAYTACALLALVLLALHPRLLPRSDDVFFLATPAESLAALTGITWALAAAHESCHWLAARAGGVRAKITLGRRLYFLVLEIDLTGLWSLPRRARYSALLAGLAFDGVLLAGVLVARTGASAGWWQIGGGGAHLLSAIAFVECAAIASQFWVFARTDLYAVLVTATGCVNLQHVTRLMLRAALRLATSGQLGELAVAHPRDRAVASWFRWVHALGMLAAGGFFVLYFLPISVQLLAWTVTSLVHAGAGSERFREALLYGSILLAPEVLTLAVALRDRSRSASP